MTKYGVIFGNIYVGVQGVGRTSSPRQDDIFGLCTALEVISGPQQLLSQL